MNLPVGVIGSVLSSRVEVSYGAKKLASVGIVATSAFKAHHPVQEVDAVEMKGTTPKSSVITFATSIAEVDFGMDVWFCGEYARQRKDDWGLMKSFSSVVLLKWQPGYRYLLGRGNMRLFRVVDMLGSVSPDLPFSCRSWVSLNPPDMRPLPSFSALRSQTLDAVLEFLCFLNRLNLLLNIDSSYRSLSLFFFFFTLVPPAKSAITEGL